mmetsp:Transcript_13678/g.23260  ORF Transcript_13678/g.23260 Transcript_13678/m.23260 type:complete len:333 (+) Transcript_13678:124-1122(+)|eukprot:CAMPEP_0184706666 /NCGR_PEP_ID=MMETSP0313-20130426/36877_1 /TAXON_ID=2792 /ORGANISM="Porphyridium aerugineum, Strain SAG 1380-2" /LENGTH=332 /DNA_ID=CAMNT_0027168225 /DNA_START=43 /DNA_END=1041 /DNA_ORIENTATION=+
MIGFITTSATGSISSIHTRSSLVSLKPFSATAFTAKSNPRVHTHHALTMKAEVGQGNGDLQAVTLTHDTSKQSCTVYSLGATVTSWKVNSDENFFTSSVASWDGSKPIRAGIPICWPQFGPYGDLQVHGFARNVVWKLKSAEDLADGSSSATFVLDNSCQDAQVAKWGATFVAEYVVSLSNAGLETSLFVKNTGAKPLKFTFSLHNYFKVNDIDSVKIFGLEKLKYTDRLDKESMKETEEDMGAGLEVHEETDKIFYNAPEELAIVDMSSLKLVKMKKTASLSDATLWNPYGSKGADPGWKNFVCLEPAAVGTPVVLEPGKEWIGGQLLGIE